MAKMPTAATLPNRHSRKMTGTKPEPGKTTIVGNKELYIIPNAVYCDLYDDRAGMIPYDKLGGVL